VSTTAFLWFRSFAVKEQSKNAVLISGLVTFIAAYLWVRIAAMVMCAMRCLQYQPVCLQRSVICACKLVSTTAFLGFRSFPVKEQFENAVVISGLVTFIAAYHWYRIAAMVMCAMRCLEYQAVYLQRSVVCACELVSTTAFLWFRSFAIKEQFKNAVVISGLVTFIAACNGFRIAAMVMCAGYKPSRSHVENRVGQPSSPVETLRDDSFCWTFDC
jgi:hypothetical protein